MALILKDDGNGVDKGNPQDTSSLFLEVQDAEFQDGRISCFEISS